MFVVAKDFLNCT